MFGLFNKKNSLSMKEAQVELEKDKSIVLIDVRTEDEYRQGHINGSVNIPLDRLPGVFEKKVPDKNSRIFVYCLSGARSAQGCGWMEQKGYKNVTNIGGISSWRGPVARG